MRPERKGAVAAAATLPGGGRPCLWHTPTPYLFLGFALMMGLIAMALLALVCARRSTPSSSSSSSSAVRVLVPLDKEPKVVVVMAGDTAPSFLASAMPLEGAV